MDASHADKRKLLKTGCLRFLWQVVLWLAIGYALYIRWRPVGIAAWLGYIAVWTLLTVVVSLLLEGLLRWWTKKSPPAAADE